MSKPIAIHQRAVSLLETDALTLAVSKLWMPFSYLAQIAQHVQHSLAERQEATTYAYLMCLIASSSGKTQLCHSGEPYDMHPRMIFDTFSPEFPRRTAGSTCQHLAQRSLKERIQTDHTASLAPLECLLLRYSVTTTAQEGLEDSQEAVVGEGEENAL